MKEKVIELQELSKGVDTQMVEIKKGLNQVYSILAMMEQGASSNSVEAIPMMVCMVKQNLKDLVGSKVGKVNEYTVRTNIILSSLADADEKPKRTRKPRTPKPKDVTKPADKQVRKTVTKKAEPAEKIEETKVEEVETVE